MTAATVFRYEENLPMPLIYLHSADDLARWQVDRLEWAYEQGHRDLAISCFDTASMGFDVSLAASAVVPAVADFLQQHPAVTRLQILCGDLTTLLAYSLHWAARR